MENQTLQLDILTPEKKVVSAAVKFVAAPGVEGEFGVLPGHADFFSLLKSGEVVFEDAGGSHHVAVSWGYAHVRAEAVSILVENAEKAEEIDIERAKKDLEHWEQASAEVTSEDHPNFETFKAKIERAKARIETAQRMARR